MFFTLRANPHEGESHATLRLTAERSNPGGEAGTCAGTHRNALRATNRRPLVGLVPLKLAAVRREHLILGRAREESLDLTRQDAVRTLIIGPLGRLTRAPKR